MNSRQRIDKSLLEEKDIILKLGKHCGIKIPPIEKLRKNGMNKQFPASDELMVLRYISCFLRWFMQDDGVYNLYKKLKNGESINDN
ncbi:hypothetical protein [Brachyspira sp.]|uniref:hypothetical protein n=1 Tax=Brachyspira sp. TaxID=1977261 RepID=UPI003D7C8D3A